MNHGWQSSLYGSTGEIFYVMAAYLRNGDQADVTLPAWNFTLTYGTYVVSIA